jgi:hypothetical protein
MTPGFDVFDQPPTANALRFVYLGRGQPSKVAVDAQYHSDQLGMYGEFFVMFGWASLPVFFLLAFGLKRVYAALSASDPFALVMKRVIVLSVFAKSVFSFGVDWTIAETLPYVIGAALYTFFISSERQPVPDVAPPEMASGLAPL